MKINTLKIMKSYYDIDNMRMFNNKGTHKNPTRKRINKHFKNKWRRVVNKQMSINE